MVISPRNAGPHREDLLSFLLLAFPPLFSSTHAWYPDTGGKQKAKPQAEDGMTQGVFAALCLSAAQPILWLSHNFIIFLPGLQGTHR